ncbi:MAG: hypothetical protein AAF682_31645 [Planctomycetota bacterium]
MKNLAAAALLLSLHPSDPVELVPRVPDGVLVTECKLASSARLESTKLFADGKEVPVPGGTSRTIEVRQAVVFRDAAFEAKGGRVDAFARTYTAARRTSSMQMVDPFGGEHADEGERGSPLVEEPLRFAREEGVLVARRSDGTEQAGALPTPDWTVLLPAEPVEVGDSWPVPVDLLAALREPGGELAWEMAGEGEESLELLAPAGSTVYEGEAQGTLEALEGGVARIALAVRATARLDLTPFLPKEDVVEHTEGPHRPTIEKVVIVSELEGEGELRWLVDAGRADSLALKLEGTEVETVDYGHSQLAFGHDVELSSISRSAVTERLEATLNAR